MKHSPYSRPDLQRRGWCSWNTVLCTLAMTWSLLATAGATPSTKPPNVVFFLVDDLGWADLGCYGSRFHQTPHIDALRASGMKFTAAYTAASICSPTRASLMTGKHPVRLNITDWIPGLGDRGRKLSTPEDRHELPLAELTLGEALQAEGYHTFYAGKWHLGGVPFGPDRQGFEVYFDPHQDPSKGSPKPRAEGRPHDTRGITREALAFLGREAARSPVFLFLAYYDVHTPVVADTRFIGSYQKAAVQIPEAPPRKEHSATSRSQQNHAAYASMVSAIDDSVGQVLQKIDHLGLANETVVIFFSDNGGLCTLTAPRTGPTCNLPLRSGKGWLYEGGIRVPLLIRAPGVTTPGSECSVPVVSMDLYPTLLALTGLKPLPEQHRDGVNLVPLLSQTGSLERAMLYWHYPHYHGSGWAPGAALRANDWKLIHFYEEDGTELYDLSRDPGEIVDLSRSDPVRTRALLEELRTWQQAMNAQQPVLREELTPEPGLPDEH